MCSLPTHNVGGTSVCVYVCVYAGVCMSVCVYVHVRDHAHACVLEPSTTITQKPCIARRPQPRRTQRRRTRGPPAVWRGSRGAVDHRKQAVQLRLQLVNVIGHRCSARRIQGALSRACACARRRQASPRARMHTRPRTRSATPMGTLYTTIRESSMLYARPHISRWPRR